MEEIKKKGKRKGFTLIELVIVVAIIGILSLMLIPQFQNVTKDANIKTYEANCHAVSTAYAMFQAAHEGAFPTQGADMDPYLNGGWDKIQNHPVGATFSYDASTHQITGAYTDADGGTHPFTFPTN